MDNLDVEAHKAGARFETMIEESFIALLPNRDDFDRTTQRLGRFETGLKADDAMHLAVAGNRQAEVVYSLDKAMIAAGKTLGVPTSPGILIPGYDG